MFSTKTFCRRLSGVLLCALVPLTVAAQDEIEEIVVTADLRGRTVEDVPSR